MKKIMSTIVVLTIIFTASLAFAGQQTIEFKDDTIIKGEIQNETLTVQTSFGKLKPPTAQIAFISEGNVELKDGSKIMGSLVVDEGIVIKTKYGTWTLTFKSEDVQMITFSK